MCAEIVYYDFHRLRTSYYKVYSSSRLSAATDSCAPLVASSSTSYFESSNISRAETSARPFQLTIESLQSVIRQGGSRRSVESGATFCSECYVCFCWPRLWCCIVAPVFATATASILVLLPLVLLVQLLPLPLAVSCMHTSKYPPALYEGLNQWETCEILPQQLFYCYTAFTLPLETEPEWYRAKNCTVLAAYWQRLHCNY